MATRELTVSVSIEGGKTTSYRLKSVDEEVQKLKASGTETGEAVAGALDESAKSAKDLADAADGAGSRFSGLSGEARELGEALRDGDYERAASALGRLKGQAGSLGLALGVATGAVVTGGLAYGAAASQAIGFEDAMVEVSKTTGLVDAELDDLGAGIQTLAGRLGIAQEELAGITATAGQLGIEGREDLLAFTETVARLAAVSELSSEQASEQIARVANAFDLPIAQAENLGSVLNELSNTTTAKAGQISQALTRVGSSGASIGLAAYEVAGLGATLIDTGIEAETAGTSMRNVFIRLQSEAEALAGVAGMTQEEFSALVQDDALAALRAYLAGLREMPPELRAVRIKETFGDENFLAVQSMVEQTDLLNKNLSTSAEAFEEGTSLNTEFAAALDTVSKQWARLRGNLMGVTTAVGSSALPAMQSLLETINGLFEGTEELAAQTASLHAEQEDLDGVGRAIETYERLAGKAELTKDEQEKLDGAVRALQERFPEYVTEMDTASGAARVYTSAVRAAYRAQVQLNQAQADEGQRDLAEAYDEAKVEAEGLRESIQGNLDSIDRLERQKESARKAGGDVERIEEAQAQLAREVRDMESELRTAESDVRTSVDALVQPFAEGEDVDVQGLADRINEAFSGIGYDEALARAKRYASEYTSTMKEASEEASDDWEANVPELLKRPKADPAPDEDELALLREAQETRDRERIAAMEDGYEKRLAEIDHQIDGEIEKYREQYASSFPGLFEDIRQSLEEQRQQLKRDALPETPEVPIFEWTVPELDVEELDLSQQLKPEAADSVADAWQMAMDDKLRPALRRTRDAIAATKDEIERLQAAGQSTGQLQGMLADLERAEAAMMALQGAGDIAESALVSSFQAVGESVGQAIVGLTDQTKTLGEKLKLVLARAAQQLGQLLITIGTPMLVPPTTATGLAYVAAGTALTAIGAGIEQSIRKGNEEAEASKADKGRRRTFSGASDSGSIPGYAEGTDSAAPGWKIVGEEGPELMQTPGGESILTNENTRAIAGMASYGARAMAQEQRAARGAGSAQSERLERVLGGLEKTLNSLQKKGIPVEGQLTGQARTLKASLKKQTDRDQKLRG